MARVVHFYTTVFDVASERLNPVNRVPGESLLLWLRDKALPDIKLAEPEAEDWGWYSFVDWKGRQYILGSSAIDEVNGEWEWILQIDKRRSVAEMVSARVDKTQDDECAEYFQRLLEGEPNFQGLFVDPEN